MPLARAATEVPSSDIRLLSEPITLCELGLDEPPDRVGGSVRGRGALRGTARASCEGVLNCLVGWYDLPGLGSDAGVEFGPRGPASAQARSGYDRSPRLHHFNQTTLQS